MSMDCILLYILNPYQFLPSLRFGTHSIKRSTLTRYSYHILISYSNSIICSLSLKRSTTYSIKNKRKPCVFLDLIVIISHFIKSSSIRYKTISYHHHTVKWNKGLQRAGLQRLSRRSDFGFDETLLVRAVEFPTSFIFKVVLYILPFPYKMAARKHFSLVFSFFLGWFLP